VLQGIVSCEEGVLFGVPGAIAGKFTVRRINREIRVDGCTYFHQQKYGVRSTLRDMVIGEQPRDFSAGPASLPVLGEINSFIHKHF
jgi:hypothetical protein